MRTLNLKQFANGLNFSGSTKSIVYTSGQKKKKKRVIHRLFNLMSLIAVLINFQKFLLIANGFALLLRILR